MFRFDPDHTDTDVFGSSPFLIRIRIQGNDTDLSDPDPQHWRGGGTQPPVIKTVLTHLSVLVSQWTSAWGLNLKSGVAGSSPTISLQRPPCSHQWVLISIVASWLFFCWLILRNTVAVKVFGVDGWMNHQPGWWFRIEIKIIRNGSGRNTLLTRFRILQLWFKKVKNVVFFLT